MTCIPPSYRLPLPPLKNDFGKKIGLEKNVNYPTTVDSVWANNKHGLVGTCYDSSPHGSFALKLVGPNMVVSLLPTENKNRTRAPSEITSTQI